MKSTLFCFLFVTGAGLNLINAQPDSFRLTNSTTVASPHRSVVFESTAVPMLSSSVANRAKFTIYSIGPNHKIVATNVYTPNAPLSGLTVEKNLLLIPSDRKDATNSAQLSKGKFILPAKLALAQAPNDPSGQAILVLGNIFLNAVESPLRWDAQANAYATKLAIGVDFPGHPEVSRLPEPLSLQLLTENASVNPEEVIITHAGPPYDQVQLQCNNAGLESSVAVHNPLIQATPLKIECLVELGKLMVDCQDRIAGYGVGTSKVTVRRLAKDGTEIRSAGSLEVSLRTSLGKLDCGNSVTIPANQSSVDAELRSAGLGSAQITANANNVVSEMKMVSFYFPMALVVATLLGGLLGGVGHWLKPKGKAKASPKLGISILGGLVFGTMIVAAAYAGIAIFSLPPLVLSTELGAFVTAAIAGYLGSTAADKLVKRFP